MSLINFVLMEFKKVKGNRTFLITVIGALILPILYTLIQVFLGGNEIVSSLDIVYGFSLMIFSVIFAAVIINYLFTVDIETHTLKSLIPLPISRRDYIVGKLATLLIWMISLSLITIISSLILFSLSGMSGFDLMPILKGAGFYIWGTFLLFLVMIPIAFLTVFTANTSASLVVSVLLLFLNFMPIEQLEYNPWSLPASLASADPGQNILLAYGVIIVVAIIGYALLRYVFYKRDIPL